MRLEDVPLQVPWFFKCPYYGTDSDLRAALDPWVPWIFKSGTYATDASLREVLDTYQAKGLITYPSIPGITAPTGTIEKTSNSNNGKTPTRPTAPSVVTPSAVSYPSMASSVHQPITHTESDQSGMVDGGKNQINEYTTLAQDQILSSDKVAPQATNTTKLSGATSRSAATSAAAPTSTHARSQNPSPLFNPALLSMLPGAASLVQSPPSNHLHGSLTNPVSTPAAKTFIPPFNPAILSTLSSVATPPRPFPSENLRGSLTDPKYKPANKTGFPQFHHPVPSPRPNAVPPARTLRTEQLRGSLTNPNFSPPTPGRVLTDLRSSQTHSYNSSPISMGATQPHHSSTRAWGTQVAAPPSVGITSPWPQATYSPLSNSPSVSLSSPTANPYLSAASNMVKTQAPETLAGVPPKRSPFSTYVPTSTPWFSQVAIDQDENELPPAPDCLPVCHEVPESGQGEDHSKLETALEPLSDEMEDLSATVPVIIPNSAELDLLATYEEESRATVPKPVYQQPRDNNLDELPTAEEVASGPDDFEVASNKSESTIVPEAREQSIEQTELSELLEVSQYGGMEQESNQPVLEPDSTESTPNIEHVDSVEEAAPMSKNDTEEALTVLTVDAENVSSPVSTQSVLDNEIVDKYHSAKLELDPKSTELDGDNEEDENADSTSFLGDIGQKHVSDCPKIFLDIEKKEDSHPATWLPVVRRSYEFIRRRPALTTIPPGSQSYMDDDEVRRLINYSEILSYHNAKLLDQRRGHAVANDLELTGFETVEEFMKDPASSFIAMSEKLDRVLTKNCDLEDEIKEVNERIRQQKKKAEAREKKLQRKIEALEQEKKDNRTSEQLAEDDLRDRQFCQAQAEWNYRVALETFDKRVKEQNAREAEFDRDSLQYTIMMSREQQFDEMVNDLIVKQRRIEALELAAQKWPNRIARLLAITSWRPQLHLPVPGLRRLFRRAGPPRRPRNVDDFPYVEIAPGHKRAWFRKVPLFQLFALAAALACCLFLVFMIGNTPLSRTAAQPEHLQLPVRLLNTCHISERPTSVPPPTPVPDFVCLSDLSSNFSETPSSRVPVFTDTPSNAPLLESNESTMEVGNGRGVYIAPSTPTVFKTWFWNFLMTGSSQGRVGIAAGRRDLYL
jgi:hypothetical protein